MSGDVLELYLLGSPRWRRGDAAGALSCKDAALLALLALDGSWPRARLSQVLWPDHPHDNLRQRTKRLGDATGHALFERRRASLALAPSVRVDAACIGGMTVEQLVAANAANTTA